MSFGGDYASIDGNKPPHWPNFLASGASFIWIRGSFAYWDAAHGAWVAVGDPVCHRDWNTVPTSVTKGAYMFPVLQASQSPEEQVGVFKASMDALGGLKPGVDFPPCIDIEFPNGIAHTGLNRVGVLAWLRRAIVEMERVFGCKPILYTSGRVWNDSDADCLGNPPASDLLDCPMWLARYPYKTRIQAVLPPPPSLAPPPIPTPWQEASGWIAHQDQGDSLGFPGFTSTVDVDRFHTVSPGDHDPLVRYYKRKLMLLLGRPGITFASLDATSDKYDNDMVAAVKLLQAVNGLTVDAILGVKSFCRVAWIL